MSKNINISSKINIFTLKIIKYIIFYNLVERKDLCLLFNIT